jgi:hypothetical protein
MGVEKLARFIHRQFPVLASITVLGILLLVLADNQTHWLKTTLPSTRQLSGLGKSVGKVALLAGLAATLYYAVRESWTWLRRRGKATGWLQPLIPVLRMTHPIVGALAFALVMFHGYVMWQVQAARGFDAVILTGLASAAALMILAVSGSGIYRRPQWLKLRFGHRWLALLFLLLMATHLAKT